MATVLDKTLKREIALDGASYIVTLDPAGLRITGKGRRKPQVELRWTDLVSGEAALATALNASLRAAPPEPPRTSPGGAPTPAPRKTSARTAKKSK
jgi:hypothetical protein